MCVSKRDINDEGFLKVLEKLVLFVIKSLLLLIQVYKLAVKILFCTIQLKPETERYFITSIPVRVV